MAALLSELFDDLLYLPIGYLGTPGRPDDVIRAADFFVDRPLCRQPRRCLFTRQTVTRHDTPQLLLGGTCGDDHPVELGLVSGLVQQRNVGDSERRVAR